MKKIKYAIRFWDVSGNKRLGELNDLDSLPRIQIGDYIDEYQFNHQCDVGWLSIVVDAHYTFSGDKENPALDLTLYLRSESGIERMEKFRKLGRIT